MSLLLVATLRAESWALIGVLRSARLRHVSLTWLLSPLLARDTSDRPAVIFQPSDSYTCGAIPLEHRHVSSQLGPGGQWLQQWVGPTAPRRAASGQYARAPRIRPKWNIEILIAMLEVQWRSQIYNIQRKCRVEVTSVGLAHARPIIAKCNSQKVSFTRDVESVRRRELCRIYSFEFAHWISSHTLPARKLIGLPSVNRLYTRTNIPEDFGLPDHRYIYARTKITH